MILSYEISILEATHMIPRYHLIHLNQMILGIWKTTKPPMFPVAVLVSLAVRSVDLTQSIIYSTTVVDSAFSVKIHTGAIYGEL